YFRQLSPTTSTLFPYTTLFRSDLNIETDHDRVGSACQQNVRFRNRSDGGVNNFETDFFAFDLFQRPEERFERALRIAFQHDAQNFLASRRFKQSFKGSFLGNDKFSCTFR